MLKPTLKLAAQFAAAYDEIRQQSNNLMTFTEVRTDPLTGVSNRRALDETLESMFAMMHRYEQPFSVVIVDIDYFKQINDEQGHLYGDRMLKAVARLLDDNVRDTDMVHAIRRRGVRDRHAANDAGRRRPFSPNVCGSECRDAVAADRQRRRGRGRVEGDNSQTLLREPMQPCMARKPPAEIAYSVTTA